MLEFKNEYKKIKTLKEFKQVLEDVAGMYFDVWGFDGLLNIISSYNEFLAKDAISRGAKSVARYDKERADRIYEYLKNKGYYDTKETA